MFFRAAKNLSPDEPRKPSFFAQLKLLRYARPHWGRLLLMLSIMALSVGLQVLRPWPMKLLLDQVLDRKPLPAQAQAILSWLSSWQTPYGLLVWVCIFTVLIYLFGSIMTMLSNDASVHLGQQMTFDLGADLFLHLQKLSLIFHSRRSVGDTISRVTGDTYCVETLVTGTLMPLLRAVVSLITMFVIMWRMQPVMTLISLGVAPLLMISIKIWGRSLKDRTRERRDLEGRMSAIVEQSLSAIPAVQAFTREELEYRRFRDYAKRTVAAYRRSTRAGNFFRLFVGMVTALGTAAMIYLGGRYALAGQMSAGTIYVFLIYLAALYDPLEDITYTASTWQGASANADRVIEILNVEQEVRDRPDAHELALRGHVRYENVCFGYEADRTVLKHVSLEARPGEVVAIVGPTGAGKTTLVNLLVRFFDPWSGRVTVDGYDLRELKVRSLRQQIAIVLQDPFIFPISAAENIAYGRPDAPNEQIVAAAMAANADNYIRRLAGGYDAVIGERGATLSGGEKQRLSIARAFLKDAPILILDEPTSALDARTETMLLSALDRLMKGRTTFIIAHRLSTIRNADKILVIDDGRIIEQGCHEELMTSGGLYSTLYRQQMEFARHEAATAPTIEATLSPELTVQ